MLLRCQTVTVSDDDWELYYELTSDDRSSAAGGESYTLYLRECLHGKSEDIFLDDFTDDPVKALQIYETFVEGLVTVVTAEDILWELL